jgi:hypothetical protein
MSNKIPLSIADFETQISGAIGVGDTSFNLASATDDDGNALPAGKYCFTINNGSSNKQYLLGQLNSLAVTSVVTVSRQGVETSGAAVAARSGSPVIISDFATIQRVADILRGEETLDGASPIVYDAEPTLSDRKEVATVGYVLDTVVGGTVAFDAQTIAGNGGEAISAGNLVFFKTSDQEWYKTDADTVATIEGVQLGIALGTGSDGVAITGGIQISGTYTTSGLTAGALYYASNTAGAIASSAGTNSKVIGLALSTTKLLITLREYKASETQEGSVEEATSAEVVAGTAVGGSGARLYINPAKFPTLTPTPAIATGSSAKNLADATTTQTIAHGLGVAPTYVSIKSVNPNGQSSAGFTSGEWHAGDFYNSVSYYQADGGSDFNEVSTTNIGRLCSDPADSDYQTATIAVDATNITITWTKNVSPVGTWSFVWLARADSIVKS